ncbi:MAG TPA: hypothetical protein VIN08_16185 [Ohtaekwangia sp.]|uniref:hypothetical protein n=1 Tax=Ohtaekwangia sp. TaxID=2066019 RepID=UPI002F941EEF
MSGNKIEFKIVKDAKGKEVDLAAMSIVATRSLITLMQSLTNILSESANDQSVKIQILKGSATLVAEAPEAIIKKVHKDFDDVIQNKSTNKYLVDNWLSIQTLIQEDGLEYEANFYTRSSKVPVLEKIKSSKKFKVKATRKRLPSDTDLIFLSGKLIEVGGKIPNIHIISGNSEDKYTVGCGESEAIKVNKFLYQSVMLSVWRTKKASSAIKYTFCDFYTEETIYNRFTEFITDFNKKEEVDALVLLHGKFREYIEGKDFGHLRKLMRLFNHDSVSASTLKTILIITKSLKDHEDVSQLRRSLKEKLESKIGTLV